VATLMKSVRSPQCLLLAARAYAQAGMANADDMYLEFERVARAQIVQPDNANVELIEFYAGHARRPQEALRIARLEIQNRHDVPVFDALAWALYANGEYVEADRQIEKALAVGTRDAGLFYHAGAIEAACGNRDKASRYFQQSLDLNPTSEVSENARRAVTQSRSYTAVKYVR